MTIQVRAKPESYDADTLHCLERAKQGDSDALRKLKHLGVGLDSVMRFLGEQAAHAAASAIINSPNANENLTMSYIEGAASKCHAKEVDAFISKARDKRAAIHAAIEGYAQSGQIEQVFQYARRGDGTGIYRFMPMPYGKMAMKALEKNGHMQAAQMLGHERNIAMAQAGLLMVAFAIAPIIISAVINTLITISVLVGVGLLLKRLVLPAVKAANDREMMMQAKSERKQNRTAKSDMPHPFRKLSASDSLSGDKGADEIISLSVSTKRVSAAERRIASGVDSGLMMFDGQAKPTHVADARLLDLGSTQSF